LLSFLYINDLPPTINTLSEPILFADATSIMISPQCQTQLSLMWVNGLNLTNWS
jgi:hypothetical protein